MFLATKCYDPSNRCFYVQIHPVVVLPRLDITTIFFLFQAGSGTEVTSPQDGAPLAKLLYDWDN